MGKSQQRKHSFFNAGKKKAIASKAKSRIYGIEKTDGRLFFCPYVPNCVAGKIWLLGWHCGWKFGESAYYKGD